MELEDKIEQMLCLIKLAEKLDNQESLIVLKEELNKLTQTAE